VIPPDATGQPEPREFRTTHWSMVLEAGVDTVGGRSALETLCRRYWYPLYAYARRRGFGPEEAEDLTQEFFARLLAGDSLAAVHPAKGRFRTFLLTSLQHFLSNERDRLGRQKRGGGQVPISLDALEPEARYRIEPATPATAEVVFDRQWARTLAAGVLEQMHAEATQEGSAERFQVLKVFLASEPAEDRYEALALRLGLSLPALKSAIHRLRRRYGQMLRREITHTVQSPAEVEEEIRHLFAALSA
jgi:DNA-directed RNA polymerase specialized sigma24 family protein